ncbi:uncharacterized protein [Rutidosis leptorrhynchoides]|uniref:uncharacterized protein n=1 Tax=Rutidosis leptorrhynchoides TaxID=125765 RepID=UPI003A98EEBD
MVVQVLAFSEHVTLLQGWTNNYLNGMNLRFGLNMGLELNATLFSIETTILAYNYNLPGAAKIDGELTAIYQVFIEDLVLFGKLLEGSRKEISVFQIQGLSKFFKPIYCQYL